MKIALAILFFFAPFGPRAGICSDWSVRPRTVERGVERFEGYGSPFLPSPRLVWPFCKAQLVQLQDAKQRFEAQGTKLAAISYDSPAILQDFAERHKIEFLLLADSNSEIIRSFHVLNSEAREWPKEWPTPGFFYVDSSGLIREKYFTPKYTDRLTANNVIAKLFSELNVEVGTCPGLRV